MADRLSVAGPRSALNPQLCRRLRWKTMFMALTPPDRGANTDPQHEDIDPQHEIDDGFVWCTHSMNCLGPDGAVAAREHCREGRGCFERYGDSST